jgi:ATP-dependent DNA helicase DinG
MDLTPKFVFGPSGPLSKKLPYFEFRPSQVEYADAVRAAIQQKKIALLEAQTGTGKTLGYLIPALESGRRVIVSTGTKALQEQLYFKDIPLLQKKLGLSFEYVLLKGRMNYICLLKHERLQMEPRLPDPQSVEYFQEVQKWLAETETGDISEANLPENAELWKELTISAEACLGSKCRFYNQCFVFKVKQRAETAQLIIVNHHLFFADLSLQILNNTSILPAYDVVIFDEAHQLSDVATHNLSIIFSVRNFRDLMEDLAKEFRILRSKRGPDISAAQLRAGKLAESVASLFSRFMPLSQKIRYDHEGISKMIETHGAIVETLFVSLLDELLKFVEKSEDMPQIYRRVAAQHSSLAFLLQATDESYVYWAERNETKDWLLQASPLDISHLLKTSLWPNLHSAVLTSATLFTDHSAGSVRQELGLEDCHEESFPYNFDYPSQACLYVPQNLVDPNHPLFAEKAAQEIASLVELTGGGAFVLCTSYQNLKVYEKVLQSLDYPLLVQGSTSKQKLLKAFVRKPGSVLLATMSFWQGIDVQGDALIAVIIDKLPFAVPNDPLIEAKIQYLRKLGKNPFVDYQLPMAVMMLKQGLGRLIRTSVDYGILAVLDRRILSKNYGSVFLRNLPPVPIIQRLDDLSRAFQERRQKFLRYH